MRTIKFRGKNLDGEWVYGFYVEKERQTLNGFEKKHFIVNDGYDYVKPDTVGQFTGLHDKDDKEIYEGDILSRKDGGALLKVEFRHGAFGYEYCGEFHAWAGNHNFTFNPYDTDVDFSIIGNIHDNPELITNK